MTEAREAIEVRGACEHNLRHVDVDIPKRLLTVVTGVSGSGKSSLVFDTVAVEAKRQLNETLPAFVRGFMPSFGRPAMDAIEHLPAVISVDQRPLGGGARSTVGTVTDIAPILRLLFSRVGQPHVGGPDAFSFNMPAGMCPECEGLGEVTDVDLDAFLDLSRSLNEGALLAPPFEVGSRNWQLLARSGRLDPDKPVNQYSEDELETLLYSTEGTVASEVNGQQYNAAYEGAVAKFRRLYIRGAEEPSARTRKMLAEFTTTRTCPVCGGTRLSQLALGSKIDGYTIADLSAMEAAQLLGVLPSLQAGEATPVVEALTTRVASLVGIGLGYLSLDRRTDTLSGGESQRAKIVRHLASSLNDLLYVFDEPSVGLHPRDVYRLTDLLHGLRDKGNTVLVVEHDRDVIAAADHIIDIGPGAGQDGGRVDYVGDVEGLRSSDTLTGRHMADAVRMKSAVRTPAAELPVTHANTHNLRDLSLGIPVGVLTVITGVAGSGKSSLIDVDFRDQHPSAVVVDQSAPSANRRSSVSTYTNVATPIRDAFAKANAVSPSLFSANSAGACPTCHGLGVIYTDLAFLDEVATTCPTCEGKRFNDEVLRYRLDGKNIDEVLELTVVEARDFFAKNGRVRRALEVLQGVGLGYLQLGQPLTTLSGGELQRLKLAAHLRDEGDTFILDEPTTGLHMADVENLLQMLDRLVDVHKATVIVIEHNLDVIAHADWIVDLGPEGGSGGGRIVYEGTPAGLLESRDSHTAEFLRRALESGRDRA